MLLCLLIQFIFESIKQLLLYLFIDHNIIFSFTLYHCAITILKLCFNSTEWIPVYSHKMPFYQIQTCMSHCRPLAYKASDSRNKDHRNRTILDPSKEQLVGISKAHQGFDEKVLGGRQGRWMCPALSYLSMRWSIVSRKSKEGVNENGLAGIDFHPFQHRAILSKLAYETCQLIL